MKTKYESYLTLFLVTANILFAPVILQAQTLSGRPLEPLDVFKMEYASDPQISPDGSKIIYVRNFMDIMTDRHRSNLWIIDFDGSDHRAVTSGIHNDFSPRWSPDGKKLAYLSSKEGKVQIFMRWMDTGQETLLAHLTQTPSNLTWSPDGKWLALLMKVPEKVKPIIHMPGKPAGAKWAPPAKYIDKLIYRLDGSGYLKEGTRQIFILTTEGGTPHQLTNIAQDAAGPLCWTPDSKFIYFSANLHEDHDLDPLNSEIYFIGLDGKLSELVTSRKGPDHNAVISPDGMKLAYLGFDDRLLGYQVTNLYVLDLKKNKTLMLLNDLDRGIRNPVWNSKSTGLYFQYTNHGNTKIAYVGLTGKMQILANDVGGTSLGRPYGGGSFSVSLDGDFAYTQTRPDHPAEVATGSYRKPGKRLLTALNDDLFPYIQLGKVEELWVKSSYNNKDIQGWYILPPDFDPAKKFPLILEIHGGPFADYGDRFTAELQLYAAKGYVVLYMNPRGSTSYGEDFGNLIHHAYPGHDYDDLMSGVDAMLAMGFIDKDRLFVTGGSGGGVLTAWIIGNTDRFRGAVVAKPVINWTSFALTSDYYNMFYKYWFPGFPWENQQQYWERSPLSKVGNVKTPTMILFGESDHRTPMSEGEQFYQALKLRNIDAAMVRIPEASHGITSRPSRLITKVLYILDWFKKHDLSPKEKE